MMGSRIYDVEALTLPSGLRLAYRMAGSGPAVILLHGNGESSAIYDPLIAALAGRFTVYAIDARGHGVSSSAPLWYRFMADDVAAFIRLLGLQRPGVFGFSDGGIVGLLLAMRHPGLVGSLAVAGANRHPFGVDARTLSGTAWGYAKQRNPLTRLMLTGPWISTRRLRRLRIPVLVLAGERDLIRHRHTVRMAQAIPGAMLQIIADADHGSYIVDSATLAPALSRFFWVSRRRPRNLMDAATGQV